MRGPQLEHNEARRVGFAYRAIAEELAAHPETADSVGDRQPGRRQGSRIAGGVPWGRVEGEGTSVVWCQAKDGRYLSKTVEAVERTNFALLFYGGGGVVALILVALTAFGVGMLARLVRERDDFLAATAHDLTTPLVGMRYSIGRDEDEVKRLNERMIRLVDNVKDFLKLGGRRRPKPAAFDLAGACREAYALFREDYRDLFDGRDVEISVDGDLTVFADETMTVQILWNLFGNDLKYAAPYGSVRVSLSAAGGMVRAAFVDEGQGMTRLQMSHAFDRYYRARTALESGKGGFGIGLCTAREFARAMGGDLVVGANSPKGCVFTLSLPAGPRRLPG